MNTTNNDKEPQVTTMYVNTIGRGSALPPIKLYTTSKEEWSMYIIELASHVKAIIIKYFMIGVVVGIFVGFFSFADASPRNASDKVKASIMRLAPDKDTATTLLAIAFIESSFNAKATGKLGEQGLFQFHPKYFDLKNVKTVDQQIKKAIEHHEYLSTYCKSALALCWNRGIKGADKAKEGKSDKYLKKFNQLKAAYEKAIKNQRTAPQSKREVACGFNAYKEI